jgi:hypothetical protein
MSKFIAANRRNGECEICGSESGHCRRIDSLHLCATFADAKLRKVQNGFICVKSDAGAGWASFILDQGDWTSAQREQWQAEANRRQSQREAATAARRTRSLSALDRHQGYHQLLNLLALHPDDQADLDRRGLRPEQIAAWNIKSVEQWQRLPIPLSNHLPSVVDSGRSLNVPYPGFTCAVIDANGNTVGYQIRSRNPQQGEPKYYWLTSANNHQPDGATPHLSNGELPLGVYRPAHLTQPTIVHLAEGFLKPRIVAERLGSVVLGADGAHFATRPETFAATLAQLQQEFQQWQKDSSRLIRHNLNLSSESEGLQSTSKVWFEQPNKANTKTKRLLSFQSQPQKQRCKQPQSKPDWTSAIKDESSFERFALVLLVDAGSVKNKDVLNAYWKTADLATSLGYTLQFAWWGQISKQECDIDELDPAQYKSIRMLSLREFRAIAIEQGGLAAEATTPEPDEPRNGVAWDLWRQSRQFTADQSSSQPFFTAPVPTPGSAVGIRSGTGTGKTQWLIHTVIQSLGDQGFLSIGYRNSLLIQFAQQVGLLDQDNWYHLQQDLKGSPDLQLLRDPHSKILCCIDSLTYFNPKDFEGKVIILDEVESIVNQLLKSDTAVSFQREKIKDLFGEMLRRCDRVIVLDGHLRDATIDYLRSLAGDSKQFTRYYNGYQGNKGKVEFLEGVESARGLKLNDRSPLLQAILNHQGCFVVGSDSQEELQALEYKLVEAGRKTLRFDGSTANKTWAKAFLQDPAAYIREHEVEALLYSPSAEAGLSIDLKGYFNDAYFIFFGVVTTNAQLQMLARVRDPRMQIHIVCPTQGLPSESISKSAIPEVLANEINQYVMDCATASLTGLAAEDIVLNLAQKLVQLSTDTHFNHEMFLTAIENHERVNLRDCLREALVKSGYQVKSVIGQRSTSVEVIQAKRNEVRREKAELTVKATDITTAEADQKSRSFEATEEDKYAVSRRRLLDRLPGIEAATYQAPIVQPKPEAQAQTESTIQMVEKPVFDATFVQKVRFDNRRLISQIELRWLIEHPEAAQALQQMHWHKRLSIFTNPNEPDSSKRIHLSTYHSRWLKIYKLLELGIDFFLKPGASWHAKTPEAIAFWQAAKHPRNTRAIGRRVGRSSVCTYIGEIIRSLGLKTKSTYCHTLKIHIYQVDPQSLAGPIIGAIYNSVERRFTKLLTDDCALDWEKVTQAFERLQSQSQQDVEVRSPSRDFVIKSQESDHATSELEASTMYTIEAIEHRAETVAAIFQSWQLSFKAAVVRWLETHADTALNQLIELYPDIGN